MGIWVVVMEAVAGDDPNTIEPEDLDALAEELGECYPQVSGGPAFYQAELWVEESNAGGAVMHALRVWQAAVRELGMPTWDVVRAEARDAYAIEAGLIEWNPPDGGDPEDELEEQDEDTDAGIPEDDAGLDIDTQDYALDADELELDDDEELAIPPVPASVPGTASTKRAARSVPAAKKAAKAAEGAKRAKRAKGAKRAKAAKGAKKARAVAPRPKKAAPKLAPVEARTRAKKAGRRIAKRR